MNDILISIKEKFCELLFKVFWKTKDKIVQNKDGKSEMQVLLIPRFGRIGAIIWFFLTNDGEWILEEKGAEDE